MFGYWRGQLQVAADSIDKSSCWRLLFSLSVRARHNVQASEIFLKICLFSVCCQRVALCVS